MIPLITIAKLHAREGKEGEAHGALQECQLETFNEPGNRLYALHHDESDPGLFVMVEGWDGDEALQAHLESAHLEVLRGKEDGLFEGPVDVIRLVALPVGDIDKGKL